MIEDTQCMEDCFANEQPIKSQSLEDLMLSQLDELTRAVTELREVNRVLLKQLERSHPTIVVNVVERE